MCMFHENCMTQAQGANLCRQCVAAGNAPFVDEGSEEEPRECDEDEEDEDEVSDDDMKIVLFLLIGAPVSSVVSPRLGSSRFCSGWLLGWVVSCWGCFVGCGWGGFGAGSHRVRPSSFVAPVNTYKSQDMKVRVV